MTKLWIDDLRTPPGNDWLWATSSSEAIFLLSTVSDIIEISFDHDLGGDDTTRPVVLWLCENPDKWPDYCVVHSMNPIGRTWLEGMISRYHV